MPLLNETLAAFSRDSQAAAITLREALRFKARPGSLIVQDTTGRGAMILSPDNKMGMDRRRVVWVDLADRRRPVSLFQLARSGHFRTVWTQVLRGMKGIARADLSDGAINWAVEAAWALSADGLVGLGALFRSIASPEIRRWFLDTANEPSELNRILDMLAWALSFPAVHALSEGDNRGALLDALQRPSVVWLESATEHFEPKEHLLVQVLLEAALDDALRTMAARPAEWKEIMKGLTVLHLYPAIPVAMRVDEWVSGHLGAVRHVCVNRLDPERSLAPAALQWATNSEFVWVAGQPGPVRADRHAGWLSATETGRMAEMTSSELWVRSNRSGKAFVTRVRDPGFSPGLAEGLRRNAARRRRGTSVDQVAAAIKSLAGPAEAHRGLYARLCEVDTLRAGWLRVRESRSKSSGVDGVTLATFVDAVEMELSDLAETLRAGRYRSRPLRRMQIPKPDGGLRNLGVACVRDRVVQTACLQMLEPIFEPGFSRFSYAFRPGRSAHQAVAVARARIACGGRWVVIADIRKCFDSIDHQTLLGLLARKIADDDLIALIRQWLGTEVLEFRDLMPVEIGVPQGESISPLLANIYLDPLDKHFERLGVPFVRYADDFVLFAANEEGARGAFQQLGDFLRDFLHLELKPAKSSYVPVEEGFDFLGFRIAGSSLTVIAERARGFIEYLTGNLKELAACCGDFKKSAEILGRINSILRGWRNYFMLPGEPALHAQLRELDEEVDRIAAFHLPQTLRDNPVWLCRERLWESEPDRAGRTARKPAVEPGLGYPEAVAEDVPGVSGRPTPQNVAAQTRRPPRLEPASGTTGANSALPICVAAKDGDRICVVAHGTWVGADKDDLVLKKKRLEVFRHPLEKIGLICLQGFGISMSVDAQVKLAERNVPVVLSPPAGSPAAVVSPVESLRSSIRRLQAARRDEPNVVMAGLRMLAAKISNQAAALKYFAKYRKLVQPENAALMNESAEKIMLMGSHVSALNAREANVRATAMGFEGHAAAFRRSRRFRNVGTWLQTAHRISWIPANSVAAATGSGFQQAMDEIHDLAVAAGDSGGCADHASPVSGRCF